MKQNWQIKKLGEVCEVIAGQSPEGKFYNQNGEGTPFYQGKKDFGEKYLSEPTVWTINETKIAIENDILMSVRAPVGDINICNKRICIGRGLAAIRASNKLDNDFLFYYLLSEKPNIKGKEGAVFPTINKNEIAALEISLPPLADQRRIVAILDAKFAKIDALKAAAQKNLDNAEQLWKAQLEKEFGNKEWKMMKLGEVCDSFEYGTSKKSCENGKVPVLRMGNIQNRELDFTDLVYTNDEKDIEKYMLHNGDVLFNRTNSPEWVGKTAIFRENFPAIFAGYIIRVNYKRDILNGEFLNYWLNADSTMKYGYSIMTSSVHQANISGTKLSEYTIPIPSLAEQTAIVSRLDALSTKISNLKAKYRRQIECCDELRQSLLREAFEGEM